MSNRFCSALSALLLWSVVVGMIATCSGSCATSHHQQCIPTTTTTQNHSQQIKQLRETTTTQYNIRYDTLHRPVNITIKNIKQVTEHNTANTIKDSIIYKTAPKRQVKKYKQDNNKLCLISVIIIITLTLILGLVSAIKRNRNR